MASQVAPRHTGSFFKEKRVFGSRFPNGMPVGKRTKERAAANRDMGKQGIGCCEIRIPGVCVGRMFLTWMHETKSRYIVTKKDWRTAARACQPCHQYGEDRGHKFMGKLVRDAIARRKALTR